MIGSLVDLVSVLYFKCHLNATPLLHMYLLWKRKPKQRDIHSRSFPPKLPCQFFIQSLFRSQIRIYIGIYGTWPFLYFRMRLGILINIARLIASCEFWMRRGFDYIIQKMARLKLQVCLIWSYRMSIPFMTSYVWIDQNFVGYISMAQHQKVGKTNTIHTVWSVNDGLSGNFRKPAGNQPSWVVSK